MIYVRVLLLSEQCLFGQNSQLFLKKENPGARKYLQCENPFTRNSDVIT